MIQIINIDYKNLDKGTEQSAKTVESSGKSHWHTTARKSTVQTRL